ncbi:MAG TPA: hypothetical protein ACFYD4_06175 [Candidatus Wunengus sp. YC61]|uniref:hypothetical protein n=1 Tax=Candidatus Wunengus sp. YC61 TaxID=3367698 RepID=UPI004025EC75
MSEYIQGRWHKVKMRCEFCGLTNPHDQTYIINSEKVTGKFCSERCAKGAMNEMEQAKKEGTL